jgi:hypothetical protein
MDKEEPRETRFSTEMVKSLGQSVPRTPSTITGARPNTDTVEPIRYRDRSERLDPTWAKLKTDMP